MAVLVFLYGKSGSGKSRSLKNFADDEIFYVNVENKPLPFKRKFKYTVTTHDANVIQDKLKNMHKAGLKTAVIDDCGYVMTDYFMSHRRNMKGNASYEMYNQIADDIYNIANCVKNDVPDDSIVYIIFHEDVSDTGDVIFRTMGKLLEQKVCLEGMTTIVIRCMTTDKKHYFRVYNSGDDIVKTPEDMFSEAEIENDLKFVNDKIREYYGLDESEENR